MPVLALTNSITAGIQVQAQITISRPRLLHLRQSATTDSATGPVVALLDTGAE